MAISIDNLQTFTDAELLILYRHAFATGAAGEERQLGDGRRLRFPPIDKLMKAIEWLEARTIADEFDGTALLQFNDPQ